MARIAFRWLWVSLAGVGLAGPIGAQSESPPDVAAQSAAAEPARNDYTDPATWLCRPGRPDDACAIDLRTTAVAADGALELESFTPLEDPPIDCFYVYPTVSVDPSPNSDMRAGPEERSVIEAQFARFASRCRVYAPLYRQITLTALRATLSGEALRGDRGLALRDVTDAWRHYLENDNRGRGFVLIGHSQGAGMLTRLIQNEIDGKPVQRQLVSALLLGTNLPVPAGADVGGAFETIPLCRSATQIGCAVAYATFDANVPPPEDALFGRVREENRTAACVNPAAPGGGSAELRAYLPTAARRGRGPSNPIKWVADPEIETPFVTLPGLIRAQCVSDERGSYLAVSVDADPDDPRTDRIGGEVEREGQALPAWGLHLIDVQVAMGNLLDLVEQQGRAYLNER